MGLGEFFDLKKELLFGGIGGAAAAFVCFALSLWIAGLSPSGEGQGSHWPIALAGLVIFGPAIGLVAALRPEYRKRPGKRD